jgi:hypothetical protein
VVSDCNPGSLHPDLFADPRVRRTLIGGYEVDTAGGTWDVNRGRRCWTAYRGPAAFDSEGDDVNALIEALLLWDVLE